MPFLRPLPAGLSTRYSRVPARLGLSLSTNVPLRLIVVLPLPFQRFLPSLRCWSRTSWPAARGVTLPRTLTTSSPTVTTCLLTFAVTVYAAAWRAPASAAWAVVAVMASGPATTVAAAARLVTVVVMRFMRVSPCLCAARAGVLRRGDAAERGKSCGSGARSAARPFRDVMLGPVAAVVRGSGSDPKGRPRVPERRHRPPARAAGGGRATAGGGGRPDGGRRRRPWRARAGDAPGRRPLRRRPRRSPRCRRGRWRCT